jgi:hypothetical protein
MCENRLELFRGRHFRAEIIVLCIRWYLRYPLSYLKSGGVEFYFGELFPRVGFIVTNLETDSRAVVRFYNKRGTAAAADNNGLDLDVKGDINAYQISLQPTGLPVNKAGKCQLMVSVRGLCDRCRTGGVLFGFAVI